MNRQIIWICAACGADLGDHATVASGDCVHCGRILCENCYDYDESAAQVTCAGSCFTGADLEQARQLAEVRASDSGRYQQYIGYFDQWVFATVTEDVTTKSGFAFAAGERVLIKPDTGVLWYASGPSTDMAFSMRLGCTVSIWSYLLKTGHHPGDAAQRDVLEEGQPAAPVYLTLDSADTSLWGLTNDTLHPRVCASFGNPVRDLLPWWDDREPTGIRLLHRAGLDSSWHLVGEAGCDCAGVEQPRSKMRPRSWESTLPQKITP